MQAFDKTQKLRESLINEIDYFHRTELIIKTFRAGVYQRPVAMRIRYELQVHVTKSQMHLPNGEGNQFVIRF